MAENNNIIEEKNDNAEESTEENKEEEVEFTEFEENIKGNLMEEGERLTTETLDKILPAFWNEEPFK